MEYKFTNAPVDLETLPNHQELKYTPVSKARLHKVLFVIGIWLLLVIIGITVLYIFADAPYVTLGLSAGIVLFFALLTAYQFALQKNIGYALRERDIAFKRGVLFEKITIIPFNRIQHISTSVGILDKFFKIANLNIFTAGGSGSDINIPGLTPEIAARLKDKIAHRLTEADV